MCYSLFRIDICMNFFLSRLRVFSRFGIYILNKKWTKECDRFEKLLGIPFSLRTTPMSWSTRLPNTKMLSCIIDERLYHVHVLG